MKLGNMLRVWVLVGLAGLLSWGVIAQDRPEGQSKDDPGVVQARIHKMITNLIKQLDKLADFYTQRGKAGDYEAAQRLKHAIKVLREGKVSEKIALIREAIKGQKWAEGITLGEEVIAILERLLGILRVKAEKPDLDVRKEAIRSLGEMIRRIDDLRREEHKIKEELGKLEEKYTEDIKALEKMVKEILEEQERLHKELVEDPANLLRDIEGVLREIGELEREQLGAIGEAQGIASDELKEITDILDKLREIIYGQEDLRSEVDEFVKWREGVDAMLRDLDRIIKDQKELIEETEEAMEKPTEAKGAELSRKQEGIANRARGLEDYVNAEARDPLREALSKMGLATKDLADTDFDIAKEWEEDALANLEKVREALEKWKQELAAQSAGKLAEMAKGQADLARQTQALADRMGKLGEKTSGATSQAIGKATKQVQGASGRMGTARGNIQQGKTSEAMQDQAKALEGLRDAEEILQQLQEAIAKKEGDKFEDVASKQGRMAEKAQDIARKLGDMAGSRPARNTGQRTPLQGASQSMQNASGSMGAAQQNFSSGQAGSGMSSQKQALKDLREAKERLQRIRQDVARAGKVNLQEMAKKQQELAKRAEELKRELARRAEELRGKKDESGSQGMQSASQSAQQAQQSMQEASQQLAQAGAGGGGQQGQQPNIEKPSGSQSGGESPKTEGTGQQQRQAAEGAQARAIQHLKDIMDQLKQVRKRRRAPEDLQEQIDELARRQKQIEEQTKELRKKVGDFRLPDGERMRGLEDALEKAQGKMKGAGGQMKQRYLDEAEREADDAEKELRRARQQAQQQQQEQQEFEDMELLTRLHTELRKILEKQLEVNKETQEIDRKRKNMQGALDAATERKLADVARRQLDLSGDMERIDAALKEEEGVVYRYVVQSVIEDMKSVADLLDKDKNTGGFTQSLQADIVRKLKEMIEALRKDIRDMQIQSNQEGGGGGGAQKKEPLTPDENQLKLLKKLEEHILERTQRIIKGINKSASDLTETEKSITRRVSREQGNLKDITEEFAKKFEREIEEREAEEEEEDWDEDEDEDEEDEDEEDDEDW